MDLTCSSVRCIRYSACNSYKAMNSFTQVLVTEIYRLGIPESVWYFGNHTRVEFMHEVLDIARVVKEFSSGPPRVNSRVNNSE